MRDRLHVNEIAFPCRGLFLR